MFEFSSILYFLFSFLTLTTWIYWTIFWKWRNLEKYFNLPVLPFGISGHQMKLFHSFVFIWKESRVFPHKDWNLSASFSDPKVRVNSVNVSRMAYFTYSQLLSFASYLLSLSMVWAVPDSLNVTMDPQKYLSCSVTKPGPLFQSWWS